MDILSQDEKRIGDLIINDPTYCSSDQGYDPQPYMAAVMEFLRRGEFSAVERERLVDRLGELIADRDSWIEAHARLYRLYHDQSPRAGEEIHVNVEGGDVYTLPLQLSGMDKPRFVVHVPCSPQAEPGAEERAAFDEAACRATCSVCPGNAATGGDWPCAKKAAKRAAQSGQRAGVAECKWSPDGDTDTGIWDSSCGESWVFTDLLSPGENGVKFCHGCGGRVVIAAAPTQQQEGGNADQA
ncbi:hypothetical protein [Ralstonia mannitolilytica]|uniref:hypothetical protein n=1 Tax=Ralstonia mannitolilytica TaxID=105219 RepID=UPI003B8BDD23